MPNNPNVLPFTASLEAISQLIPNPKAVTISATDPASDITRIADALERIAAALEKLTSEKAEPLSIPAPKPEPKPKPAKNLPAPAKSVSQAQPKPVAKPVAGIKPVSTVQTTLKVVQSPSSNGLKPSTDLPTAKKNTVLDKYLEDRKITVPKQKVKAVPANQAARDELALYLGQNFGICQDLYEKLLENTAEPDKPFEYSLIGASGKQNTKLQKFCSLLKKAGLLEYSYKGIPDYSFNLRVKAKNKDKNWLEGIWLESFIIQEVSKIVQEHASSSKQLYETLPNVKIKFEDNTEAELDLFFALGQKVFCVEAKMRRHEVRLEKWLERIKPLELQDTKSILIVVANKSEEDSQETVKDWGNVQFTGLDNLEQTVISMLKEAF